MSISEIKSLLDRYVAGSATPREQRVVEQWLEENDQQHTAWHNMDSKARAAWMLELYRDIERGIECKHVAEEGDNAPVVSYKWYRKFRLPVAAMLVVSVGIGLYYFLLSRQGTTAPVNIVMQQQGQDVLPGANKAVLTLGNGDRILLDDSQEGILTNQGGTDVSKQGEGIVYHIPYSNEMGAPVVYNTLSTPRGGQYKLVLSDGSKVWLNASSSIRYPSSFSGNERTVEITGEVFFEVNRVMAAASKRAPAKKVPFKVKIISPGGENGEVEVLGTQFNINAYADEEAVSTTLLEGSIKFSPLRPEGKTGDAVVIEPGQQVRLGKNGSLRVEKDVDLEETVAWKNGLFMMNSAAIPVVLRQLARWYDVDIVYGKGVPEGRITGDIPRNMNLSEVLKVMELSGVHFKIEDRKIVVNP